jgi:hypothetical protein
MNSTILLLSPSGIQQQQQQQQQHQQSRYTIASIVTSMVCSSLLIGCVHWLYLQGHIQTLRWFCLGTTVWFLCAKLGTENDDDETYNTVIDTAPFVLDTNFLFFSNSNLIFLLCPLEYTIWLLATLDLVVVAYCVYTGISYTLNQTINTQPTVYQRTTATTTTTTTTAPRHTVYLFMLIGITYTTTLLQEEVLYFYRRNTTSRIKTRQYDNNTNPVLLQQGVDTFDANRRRRRTATTTAIRTTSVVVSLLSVVLVHWLYLQGNLGTLRWACLATTVWLLGTKAIGGDQGVVVDTSLFFFCNTNLVFCPLHPVEHVQLVLLLTLDLVVGASYWYCIVIRCCLKRPTDNPNTQPLVSNTIWVKTCIPLLLLLALVCSCVFNLFLVFAVNWLLYTATPDNKQNEQAIQSVCLFGMFAFLNASVLTLVHTVVRNKENNDSWWSIATKQDKALPRMELLAIHCVTYTAYYAIAAVILLLLGTTNPHPHRVYSILWYILHTALVYSGGNRGYCMETTGVIR